MVEILEQKERLWGKREGAELRRLRKTSGLTLKHCLDKVKKGKAAWNTWELGKNAPDALTIATIETELFKVGEGYFKGLGDNSDVIKIEPQPAPPPATPAPFADWTLELQKARDILPSLFTTKERETFHGLLLRLAAAFRDENCPEDK